MADVFKDIKDRVNDIKKNRPDADAKKKIAILVLGGSFHPIHLGHLDMFRQSREFLIQAKFSYDGAGIYDVLILYVVAEKAYLADKVGGNPEYEYSDARDTFRIDLCRVAIGSVNDGQNASDGLHISKNMFVHPVTDTNSTGIGLGLKKQLASDDVIVFGLCGSDKGEVKTKVHKTGFVDGLIKGINNNSIVIARNDIADDIKSAIRDETKGGNPKAIIIDDKSGNSKFKTVASSKIRPSLAELKTNMATHNDLKKFKELAQQLAAMLPSSIIFSLVSFNDFKNVKYNQYKPYRKQIFDELLPGFTATVDAGQKRINVLPGITIPEKKVPTKIEFLQMTTAQALYYANANDVKGKLTADKIFALNFANDNKIGGGVVNGAIAQEETLCLQSSQLYKSLLTLKGSTQDADGKWPYADWGDAKWHSDYFISENPIEFVTTDEFSFYPRTPVKYAGKIITAAAPDYGREVGDIDAITDDKEAKTAKNTKELTTRFTEIIKSMILESAKQGCDTLILGAWGCGAFAPNKTSQSKLTYINLVAGIFRAVIDSAECKNRIPRIIFPIPDSPTYDPFKAAFFAGGGGIISPKIPIPDKKPVDTRTPRATIQNFVDAHNGIGYTSYADAKKNLTTNCKKDDDWIWYIIPSDLDKSTSTTSEIFKITNRSTLPINITYQEPTVTPEHFMVNGTLREHYVEIITLIWGCAQKLVKDDKSLVDALKVVMGKDIDKEKLISSAGVFGDVITTNANNYPDFTSDFKQIIAQIRALAPGFSPPPKKVLVPGAPPKSPQKSPPQKSPQNPPPKSPPPLKTELVPGLVPESQSIPAAGEAPIIIPVETEDMRAAKESLSKPIQTLSKTGLNSYIKFEKDDGLAFYRCLTRGYMLATYIKQLKTMGDNISTADKEIIHTRIARLWYRCTPIQKEDEGSDVLHKDNMFYFDDINIMECDMIIGMLTRISKWVQFKLAQPVPEMYDINGVLQEMKTGADYFVHQLKIAFDRMAPVTDDAVISNDDDSEGDAIIAAAASSASSAAAAAAALMTGISMRGGGGGGVGGAGRRHHQQCGGKPGETYNSLFVRPDLPPHYKITILENDGKLNASIFDLSGNPTKIKAIDRFVFTDVTTIEQFKVKYITNRNIYNHNGTNNGYFYSDNADGILDMNRDKAAAAAAPPPPPSADAPDALDDLDASASVLAALDVGPNAPLPAAPLPAAPDAPDAVDAASAPAAPLPAAPLPAAPAAAPGIIAAAAAPPPSVPDDDASDPDSILAAAAAASIGAVAAGIIAGNNFGGDEDGEDAPDPDPDHDEDADEDADNFDIAYFLKCLTSIQPYDPPTATTSTSSDYNKVARSMAFNKFLHGSMARRMKIDKLVRGVKNISLPSGSGSSLSHLALTPALIMPRGGAPKKADDSSIIAAAAAAAASGAAGAASFMGANADADADACASIGVGDGGLLDALKMYRELVGTAIVSKPDLTMTAAAYFKRLTKFITTRMKRKDGTTFNKITPSIYGHPLLLYLPFARAFDCILEVRYIHNNTVKMFKFPSAEEIRDRGSDMPVIRIFDSNKYDVDDDDDDGESLTRYPNFLTNVEDYSKNFTLLVDFESDGISDLNLETVHTAATKTIETVITTKRQAVLDAATAAATATATATASTATRSFSPFSFFSPSAAAAAASTGTTAPIASSSSLGPGPTATKSSLEKTDINPIIPAIVVPTAPAKVVKAIEPDFYQTQEAGDGENMKTTPQNDKNAEYSKRRSFFTSPYPTSVKICTSGVSEYKYLTETAMEIWTPSTERYSDHAPIRFSINSDTNPVTKQHSCSTGIKGGGGGGGEGDAVGMVGGGNDIKLISWNIAQMCNCPTKICNHKFVCTSNPRGGNCNENEEQFKARLTRIATAIKPMMDSNDYALIQEGPDRNLNMVTQFKAVIANAGLKIFESSINNKNNQFYLICKKADPDTYVNAGAILLGKQGLKFSGFAENILKAVKARLLKTYSEADLNYDFSRVWFFINKSKEKILIPVHFGFQEVKMWKRQEKLYMFMNAIVHTFRTSMDPDIIPYKNYDIVFPGDFNMNLIQRFPMEPTPIKATFLQCSDVPGQETIIYTNGDNAPSSFGGDNEGKYNPTNIDFAVYYPKVTMAASSPVAVKVTPIVAPIPISKPGPKSPVKTGSADKLFKPEDYGYNAGTKYEVYSISGTSVRLVALQSSVAYARTDAIVNAANEGCIGGGFIDGVITDLGGTILATKRQNLPMIGPKMVRCPTGTAKATSVTELERTSLTPNPYTLKSNTVIHAVGPDYREYTDPYTDADDLLKTAYNSTIQLANNFESIAFCLLSAGTYAGTRNKGGIIKIGIDAIIEEIMLQKSIKLHTIIVCAYDADKEYGPLLEIMDELVKKKTLTKGEPAKSSPSPLPPTKPTSTYTPTCTHPFCIANPGIEAVHAIIVVRKDSTEKDCIILGKANGAADLTNPNSKKGKYDLIGGNTDGKCIFQTLQEESIEESRLVSIDDSKKINIFFKTGTSEFHTEPWRNVTKNVTENKLIFVGEIDLRKTSTGGANEYYYRDATNIPQGAPANWDGNVDTLTKTIKTISTDPKVTPAFKDNTEIACQNPNKLTDPTYGYAAKHINQFKKTKYYSNLNFTK